MFSGGVSLGCLKWNDTKTLLSPSLSSAGQKPARYSAYSWRSAEGNGRGYGEITSAVSSQHSRSKYAVTAPRRTRQRDSPPRDSAGRTRAGHRQDAGRTWAGRRQLPAAVHSCCWGRFLRRGTGAPGTAPRSMQYLLHPQQGQHRSWGPTRSVPAGFTGELEELSPATGRTPGSQAATAAKHLDSWH